MIIEQFPLHVLLVLKGAQCIYVLLLLTRLRAGLDVEMSGNIVVWHTLFVYESLF